MPKKVIDAPIREMTPRLYLNAERVSERPSCGYRIGLVSAGCGRGVEFFVEVE
jgi:hypothetical protein